MSFIKKPKRNIRSRGITAADDQENEQNDDSQRLIRDSKASKPKSKPIQQSLLSFEEDLNGDDGEVFKVKKSAQSKKIKKQMDKERKKKKDKPEVQSVTNEKTITHLDQDVVVTLKNTFPILNGREAEAADPDGMSSEEEDNSRPKFVKRTDTFKIMLEHGKIPDAAMIHAARKQRQHAREMGEIVPISEENDKFENPNSRLVREDDDNDGSDTEEERIKMTVNLLAEDKRRRREEFDAAQEMATEESDKGEEEEWETQQIRKGVTGAQIAAVQQETMYYQQYLGTRFTMGNEIQIQEMGTVADYNISAVPQIPSSESLDPQMVLKKLRDRLTEINEVHRRHISEKDAALEEIDRLSKECEIIKEKSPKQAERFRFYQDLRGYVTDLVECLDEKIMIVEQLENRIETIFTRKTVDCIARRRQDVIDQTQELLPPNQRNRVERDEAQFRRIAEREGRRIRRQRAREIKGVIAHIDGMSSDEETTETEVVNSRTQIETIEQDAKRVFGDTLDEFSTIQGILQRFEEWRNHDMNSYVEAYVSLCLPKLLGPIIRLQLLFWNPLVQGNNDLDKTSWCNSILLFGFNNKETEDTLRIDPDVQLLPRVIERIVLPKLSNITGLCWDPLSNSQTVALVSLVTKLIQDYPTITNSSKFFNILINTVVDKMKDAVENDIYIPIYTQQKLQDLKSLNFFMRQCTVTIKLLGNFVRWQGILSDTLLSNVALDSVLNRYLLSALGLCSPLQAANICQMIGSVLPRIWLQVCVHPPQLTPFLNEAKLIVKQLDPTKPVERDAIERMSCVLKAINYN